MEDKNKCRIRNFNQERELINYVFVYDRLTQHIFNIFIYIFIYIYFIFIIYLYIDIFNILIKYNVVLDSHIRINN
jgi:hypothetical protein